MLFNWNVNGWVVQPPTKVILKVPVWYTLFSHSTRYSCIQHSINIWHTYDSAFVTKSTFSVLDIRLVYILGLLSAFEYIQVVFVPSLMPGGADCIITTTWRQPFWSNTMDLANSTSPEEEHISFWCFFLFCVALGDLDTFMSQNVPLMSCLMTPLFLMSFGWWKHLVGDFYQHGFNVHS